MVPGSRSGDTTSIYLFYLMFLPCYPRYLRLFVCAWIRVHVRIQLASQVIFLSGPTSPLSVFSSVHLSDCLLHENEMVARFRSSILCTCLLSLSLYLLYLFICIYISMYLFVYISIYLFVYTSIYLSVSKSKVQELYNNCLIKW